MQRKIKDLLATSPIEIEGIAGNPGTLRNGMLWYDSTAGALKARISGSTVSIGGVGGDMVLADAQTVTGAKTFSDGALKLHNVAGTFSVSFSNTATGNRTVTLPDANTKLPVFSQVVTFSGPTAARTITVPDANFTAARTDAGQTFSGNQDISSIVVTGTANYTSTATTNIASNGAVNVNSETVLSLVGTTSLVVGTTSYGLVVNQAAGSITATGFFPTVEIGHASDTTIARSAAGTVTIEGVTVATATNTLTLSNKTINGANNTLTVRLANDVSGTLPVANGGTGATTLSGLVLGNGTSAMTAVATNAALYAAITDLYVDQKVATINEDFIGGTNTDGQIGALGWRMYSISGTNSSTYILGSVDNPGQFSFSCGAASGNAGTLSLLGSSVNPFVIGNNHWELRITFKLGQTTATRFRLGLINDQFSVDAWRGEYLRYDTSLGDTHFMYVVKDGGAEVAVSSGIPADTNWHTFRMRTITPASYIYGMSMNTSGGSFGSETQVTNTNVAGGITRQIGLIIGNASVAAAKSAILDAVMMRWVCAR